MTIDQLTDHVFAGKSETIGDMTYYPRAKVFENDFFKVYYRTKKDGYFIDAVVFSKGDNPYCNFNKMTASAIKIDNNKVATKDVEVDLK